MLRGIRKASTNWLGRAVMGVVLGLLVVSFAIWGINDIFRGFGRSTLAKIGHTEIGIDQFRRAYQDRLQQIERQVGHPLPPEQVKAIGLDRQVLGNIIAESAMDQRARQMRLGVSDAEIVRQITTDKVFLGPDGKFDRARFVQILRDAGYSEQRFMAEQRNVTVRRQIIESLTGGLQVPKAWLAAINQFQNQERTIEYVTLGPAQAGDIPQPTADQLKTYFEAHKILFRAPEYRKIVTVSVTPADLAAWMQISDADVKAAYDKDHSRYSVPERRHVEQIVFPNAADADAAEAKIKGGTTFAALAAERGLKEADTDLGMVKKSDVIDPVVADAAFALKDGEISAPVKGRFGTVIVTVSKIEPEVDKPLAEVAAQIRGDIAAGRAKGDVQSLHDKIEDDRAGGATLEQAAQKLNLPSGSFEVDRSGRDPSGKVVNLPHAAQVVNAAFNSEVGVDNDPIETDGGYVWYSVTGITPAHARAFDDVKSEVEAHWREDEITSRLRAKASEIVDKLKAGTPFDAVAKADALTVQTADKLKRQTRGTVSSKVVVAAFHTAKDGFASVEGDQPEQWFVFRVTGIADPKPDTNLVEIKSLEDAVKRQISDDIQGQYVVSVEDKLGFSVNRAALDQALGNGRPDVN
ncbi:MAG: SurA N-terminal domain-containing protein [Hyphomicrobiales bacterium]|nr:SurA N-terminal domain-containing protein [Hyphomicrobiales bacterium]